MNLKQTIDTMRGSRGKSVEELSKELSKSSATVRMTIKKGNPQLKFLQQVGESLGYDLAYVDPETNNVFKI